MAARKNAAAALTSTNGERPYMAWSMPANNIGTRTPYTELLQSAPGTHQNPAQYTAEAARDTKQRKHCFEGVATRSPIRSEIKLHQQGNDDASRGAGQIGDRKGGDQS